VDSLCVDALARRVGAQAFRRVGHIKATVVVPVGTTAPRPVMVMESGSGHKGGLLVSCEDLGFIFFRRSSACLA